jgi:hypothetical protein
MNDDLHESGHQDVPPGVLSPKGFGRYGDRLCAKSGCGRRLCYLEKGLCLKHGMLETAREELKRVIAAFNTPYPYNRTLFEAYVKPLNTAVADVATQRIVSALSQFLAEHEVTAPFAWEFLQSLDPQALGYKKSTYNLILTGLRRPVRPQHTVRSQRE